MEAFSQRQCEIVLEEYMTTKKSVLFFIHSLEVARKCLAQQLEELEIPDIPEFLDLLAAAGAHMYACRLSFDMMKLIEYDLHPGVEGVISASDFIEIAEGAQIVFV